MGEEEQRRQPHSPNPDTEITENPTEQDYAWPAIRFDVPPQRTYHFCHQFRASPNPNNFLKGVKWYMLHQPLAFSFFCFLSKFWFLILYLIVWV